MVRALISVVDPSLSPLCESLWRVVDGWAGGGEIADGEWPDDLTLFMNDREKFLTIFQRDDDVHLKDSRL